MKRKVKVKVKEELVVEEKVKKAEDGEVSSTSAGGESVSVDDEDSFLKMRIHNQQQTLQQTLQEVNVFRGMARTLINEHAEMAMEREELTNKLTNLLANTTALGGVDLQRLLNNPQHQDLLKQLLPNNSYPTTRPSTSIITMIKNQPINKFN